MNRLPAAAGKSSFDLIEQEAFFTALGLDGPLTVLDAGCGVGNYAMALAERIGPGGRVIGMDAWPEGIETLRRRAAERGMAQVEALLTDMHRGIPMEAASVDLCLMATVFHDLAQEGYSGEAISEISRVLKADGRLAVVEFKRMDGPPGPPRKIRIGPNELQGRLAPEGFAQIHTVSLGAFVYMSIFRKRQAPLEPVNDGWKRKTGQENRRPGRPKTGPASDAGSERDG